MIWTGVRPYRRYLSFRLRGGRGPDCYGGVHFADKVGAVLHSVTDDGFDSSAEGRLESASRRKVNPKGRPLSRTTLCQH